MGNAFLGESSTVTERDENFKKNLCKYYGGYDKTRKYIRCMVLDKFLPSKVVIASHLFRRSNEICANMFAVFDDIDDVRNGMLMFKPIKLAFDRLQLSFIKENGSDLFKIKLFDQDICDTKLIDIEVLNKEDRELVLGEILAKRCHFNPLVTFGALDGTTFKFPTLNRPYNRCLNLQARLAYIKGLKEGRIDDSYDFNDFWSEGMSLTEKIDLLFKNRADNISGNIPGSISDNITDNTSDNITDNTSDNITDNTSDNITDNTSDNITDNVSDNTSDNITDSQHSF
jgi:hypothetical protein